ncbi:2'-5' RNA ligase [Litorivivens lipolytica]|uniref:RNA 2',3'-cyclic phosphodiesterase n=1 Tax=Litorivivens lipolytica TaxID=1524264 RepID=A0A7W4W6A4_9GAMM|nr:RNA 2',3'-cyclic phosphodiesterase [Litorivivens lipolytica]MBB3047669.1 2'-5' RNA ligase [Litorivivens lipolytica]
MSRLFVAVPLSQPLKTRLQTIQPPKTRGISPMAPDNLHLTLQFIGDADPELVIKALSTVRARSFELQFTELSQFRNGVIWLGVKDCPELKALQLSVLKALIKAGLPLEKKRFVPHITLARYKRHVPQPMIEELIKQTAADVPAEQVMAFSLFNSQTEDEELVYKRIRAFPLSS